MFLPRLTEFFNSWQTATFLTKITVLQGIGATSLIIMVGVALDLINQVKTQLLAKNYESFLKND